MTKSPRRLLVYVSGPYTAPTYAKLNENVRAAEAAMIMLMNAGASVICPHKNTYMIDGAVSTIDLLWSDFEQIRRCDAMYVLQGWQTSLGTRMEMEIARRSGVPIFHASEDDDELLKIVKRALPDPRDVDKHLPFPDDLPTRTER
ncbi:MAG TPA: DUF1937 family protein [Smithellaceae bacterium]|jgi:hypothetical protein|nr:DUF1937 family protein [Bacillota bacterium]HQC10194.1 DUF1937 family protein [Smithellaceae bacterium]